MRARRVPVRRSRPATDLPAPLDRPRDDRRARPTARLLAGASTAAVPRSLRAVTARSRAATRASRAVRGSATPSPRPVRVAKPTAHRARRRPEPFGDLPPRDPFSIQLQCEGASFHIDTIAGTHGETAPPLSHRPVQGAQKERTAIASPSSPIFRSHAACDPGGRSDERSPPAPPGSSRRRLVRGAAPEGGSRRVSAPFRRRRCPSRR